MQIKSITIQKSTSQPGSFLVVVKARQGDNRLVAFESAGNASEALRAAIEKLDNQTARFRADRPYNPAEA